MNGIRVLADTNVFIYLKNGDGRIKLYLDLDFYYSDITEIELLGRFGISKSEKQYWSELFDLCLPIYFDSHIKSKSIELKQKYKLKIPDAIIAASAIVKNVPLLSADFGFSQVKELDLIFVPS